MAILKPPPEDPPEPDPVDKIAQQSMDPSLAANVAVLTQQED